MSRSEKPFIVVGVGENLGSIPHHRDVVGIERILLLSGKLLASSPIHVAGHLVTSAGTGASAEEWKYTEAHVHDCDEVNVVWSESGELVYRIELDGASHLVRSPSAVFVPAGTRHRAEAVSGRGSFFCILLSPHSK